MKSRSVRHAQPFMKSSYAKGLHTRTIARKGVTADRNGHTLRPVLKASLILTLILSMSLFIGCGGKEDKELMAVQERLLQMEKRLQELERWQKEFTRLDDQTSRLQQTILDLEQTMDAIREEQAVFKNQIAMIKKNEARSTQSPKKVKPAPKAKTPSTDTTKRFHTVKEGETLYRIAISNDMSVDELKRLNKLRNNVIKPGQKLIVSPK